MIMNVKTMKQTLIYGTFLFTGCILVTWLFNYYSTGSKGYTILIPTNHPFQRLDGTNANISNYLLNEFIFLDRQKKRKRNILEVCRRKLTTNSTSQNGIKPSDFRALFVDDNRRLLYCEVPKVACTNWKRILLILTGKVNTTVAESLLSKDVHGELQNKYLKRLDEYTPDQIQYRLDNYYKFMFVREPFERLLSAYHNKFTSKYNGVFKKSFGRKIVKLYRKSPSNESLSRGDDVRFEEFVKYLIDTKTTKLRPFNPHWERYHKLCNPCFVQYDLIGKYETLREDVDLALSQMGVSHLVKFPDAVPKRKKTPEILAKTFANISDADIHQLWKIYSTDIALFGYEYPSFMINRA